ncbi:PD-(D/E)XK nuclease family transposase [Candidatus Thiosymbion oneisti]|uniref:PD-(D/E)XK nuclease family transposase n=1 Tax=Candidatus Thiosymbion oneisti TaxID=589554 RepID=UPI000B7C7194|nr:PD-(D/E)XK nuclease family transposase [Candidatus Thiosymbion oneisti]
MKKTGCQIVTFDWVIKTILRDKANFDVLEGFLTALFGRAVVILDMLESESNRQDDRDKYNRVDLLAKTEDGERIIVEVQYLSEMAYLKRLTYGTGSTPLHLILRSQRGEKRPDARRASAGIAGPISSSRNNAAGRFSPRPEGAPQTRQGSVTALGNRESYSLRAVPCLGAFGGALRMQNKVKRGTRTMVETLKLGEPYANLKKVYSISLLYFDVTEDGDDYIYHGKTEFTGLHTHHPVTLKKSLVGEPVRIGETNIFPEYYLIPLKRFTDVVRDDLDQWVYAFKNNEVLDEFTAPGIGALKEKFDYLRMDERERRRFDKHIDYVRSEWGMIEDARQDGLEVGLARGREEERRILVKSLYDNGIAIETIATSVGLSEPAIRRLLDDMSDL